MKTRANFKSHPIHQMLVPLPIGFLVGAFLFDVLGWILYDAELWNTGGRLVIAGIIAGLLAAVFGFIDYLYSVPPRSSGKTRATKHMITNVVTLAIFAIVYGVRQRSEPDGFLVLVEAAGMVTLGMAGWMGGTLVNRNFIGPDHRYREAGKWKEVTVPERPGEPVRVAASGELKVGQMKLVHAGARRIVLARNADGYVAFDDACTHRGGCLADGVLINGTVQCLWHGSQFDTQTGAVKAGPAEKPISTYRIELTDSEVRLVI